jgi:hypothetical protein
MLKLYYTPDTCALASHIALNDAGAEYTTVRISFAGEEQRKPEYLAVHPKGRVPARPAHTVGMGHMKGRAGPMIPPRSRTCSARCRKASMPATG